MKPAPQRPVEVATNDIAAADENGVVIIPRHMIDAVIAQAQTSEKVDQRCMSDIVAGRPIAETFKEHRG